MAVDFNLGTNVESAEFDVKGIGGAPGKSAYELAVKNGFEGTEAEWLESLKAKDPTDRVTSLDDTPLDAHVINARGGLVYVKEETIEQYAHFNITQTGWYVFARIAAETGTVLENVTVTGAAGYIVNDGYVDIAVRFVVAAVSQAVTIAWNADTTEVFVFAAVDRAIDSLDYRVTFYVYDIADYTKWEYKRSEDAVFVGTEYYTEENGVYTRAAVKAFEPVPANTYYTHSYIRSEDEVFLEGVTYYTLSGGIYTSAEVTPGEPLVPEGADPAPEYYIDSWILTTDTEFVGNRYFEKIGDNYEQIAVKAGEPCSFYTKHIEYPLTTDTAFVGTAYWTPDDSDLGYCRAAVIAGEEIPAGEYFTHTYTKLTAAGKFAEGVRYYKLVGTEYELQEVTVGASYAKNVYYIDHWTEATGSFVGTVYWTVTDGEWSQAAVIAGEDIPEGEYHLRVITWPQAIGEIFESGVTYYTHINGAYEEISASVGSPIPAYYVHSKVTFEGMIRNITYVCNTPIDCPTVYKLPVISDETHGCWYEIRFLHTGNFSSTLEVPEGVKVATEHTQAETKGINMVNLHYTAIGGTKVWRFMNTHSTIPA